jgi:hypothetical protein
MNLHSVHRFAGFALLAAIVMSLSFGAATDANAASIVKVTYQQDGKLIATMIYTGADGGPSSDRSKYWALLDSPGRPYDVTIKPDKAGGKVATLKGKLEVAIMIRNKFSMGIAKTDHLQLIRSDASSDAWHLSPAERKRLEALVAKPPKKEPNREEANAVPAVREILEKGGPLPSDLVLRLSANMFTTRHLDAAQPQPEQRLEETWEFTSDLVYRVVAEREEGKYVQRRIDSRRFDSAGLLKDLLDGNLLAIELGDGAGDSTLFAATGFDLGDRSIELLQDGEPLVGIYESCVAGGYAESDSLAFTSLYETLAKQARAAFAKNQDPR